jgi:hypothetical protein
MGLGLAPLAVNRSTAENPSRCRFMQAANA